MTLYQLHELHGMMTVNDELERTRKEEVIEQYYLIRLRGTRKTTNLFIQPVSGLIFEPGISQIQSRKCYPLQGCISFMCVSLSLCVPYAFNSAGICKLACNTHSFKQWLIFKAWCLIKQWLWLNGWYFIKHSDSFTFSMHTMVL